MGVVRRLVTHVDLDDGPSDRRRLALSARHEAELDDGRRILLLDDRGWSQSVGPGTDIRQSTSAADIADTARTVVGPDELADLLGRSGVTADADSLRSLPHDVEIGERVRGWLI